MGESGDLAIAVKRLIDDSQSTPAYLNIESVPEGRRNGLYELINCAGNAYQLLHDASCASNGHSRMMSVSHAINNLERYCDELDNLHGLELISAENYNKLMGQVTTIIENVKSNDADEDEGF